MYVSQNEYVALWKKIQDSFEIYQTFSRCTITEFEWKFDVQNHEFGWVRIQNRFFLLIIK